MMALVRRWGWVGAALIGAALVTAVLLLQTDRSAARTELAGLSEQMAEREADTEELAHRADEAEDLAEQLESAQSKIERLESKNTKLEAEIAAVREDAEQARADAAAASSPPESTTPTPTATSEPDPCDQLGMGHEQGSDWCAELLQDMRECEQRIANDPDWVHFDGGLYEHVVTGEVTTCDV
jgi:chromosome segregation ATPase